MLAGGVASTLNGVSLLAVLPTIGADVPPQSRVSASHAAVCSLHTAERGGRGKGLETREQTLVGRAPPYAARW